MWALGKGLRLSGAYLWKQGVAGLHDQVTCQGEHWEYRSYGEEGVAEVDQAAGDDL